MAKLMLIDGNSLLYRAFYAIPTSMMTASGQVTNAVYGFTSMLLTLWSDHTPDRVVVVFDLPIPTFRHKMIPTYKANRRPTPELLIQQQSLVREMIDILGVPIADAPGFEADDVIATLATQGRDANEDVIIVTGDRDSFQLVEDPHIQVLYNRQGVTDYVMYNEKGIFKRTGVKPSDYVLYSALRGDLSDNLPGVRGVGEKTAAQIINEFGGLEEIFESTEKLAPRIRKNLVNSEELVRSNVHMMQLVRDVDMSKNLKDITMRQIDVEDVRNFFDRLDFRSLYSRLSEMSEQCFNGVSFSEQVLDTLEPNLVTCANANEAIDLLNSLACEDNIREDNNRPLAFTASGCIGKGSSSKAKHSSNAKHSIGDLFFVIDGDASLVQTVPNALLQNEAVFDAFASLVGCRSSDFAEETCSSEEKETDSSQETCSSEAVLQRRLVVHDSKSMMRCLDGLGVEMRDPYLDTMLAAYLLESSETVYELEGLVRRYTKIDPSSLVVSKGQLNLQGLADDLELGAAKAVLAVDRLVRPLRKALENRNLVYLNDNVEVPLVRVLVCMEKIGIGADKKVLKRLRDELTNCVAAKHNTVLRLAGRDFNLKSPKQLAEVLFEDLGLTPVKRNKRGYSTDARSLERLKHDHPIISHIVEYRELEKLRSTYVEGLLPEVQSDNRIRATFNQTVVRTGRLSSDAPNLHNIPVRSEWGKQFRSVFVAKEGHRMLIADYDQIELRCIAHLSKDPNLISAFNDGDDVHTATAARVFGTAPADVDAQQRSKAKMVSYGLIYGMGAYGLASRLNITNEEAMSILDAYFATFPMVREYMYATVEEASNRGYTETLFGRRRSIPELKSLNTHIRQAGERQAMNACVQGLAADIFKVALVRLDQALQKRKLLSAIVLQVHDEVIVESPISEVASVSETVVSIMTEAYELLVPLEVDLKVVRTWAEAKE